LNPAFLIRYLVIRLLPELPPESYKTNQAGTDKKHCGRFGYSLKAEPVTPHLLSLNQDIVAIPQEEKCGLKYDTFTFQKKRQGQNDPAY
jgi:hypothetical protein